MARLVEWYFNGLKVLAVFFLLVMLVLVFGNVVLRYGFNTGISVSEELSRWAFVWLTFIGAIIVLRERQHMSVDTALRKMPVFAQQACRWVGQLLMLMCSMLFFWGSWQQVEINIHTPSPATGLSMGLFYGAGMVFGLCASLIHLYEMYRLLRGEGLPEPPSDPNIVPH